MHVQLNPLVHVADCVAAYHYSPVFLLTRELKKPLILEPLIGP